MPKQYRAFSPDFVNHMRSMWPLIKTAKAWLAKHGDRKIGNTTYTQLKAGRGEAPHHSRNIIESIVDRENRDGEPSRTRLFAFLSKRGIADPKGLSVDEIIAIVCSAVTLVRPTIPLQINWMAQGFKVFGHVINLKRRIERSVTNCPDEKALRECIHWMFVTVGQEVASMPTLKETLAIDMAERHMRITEADYVCRAAEWLKAYPWTILRARGRDRLPTGMTIMLPLKASAYERVRNGEIASYECGSDDFEIPSNHILAEAAIRRPEVMKGDSLDVSSKSLFRLAVIQVAVLSRFEKSSVTGPIHLLSFAGTPETKKVLLSHNYKLVGQKMAKTGVDLLEREVDLGSYPVDEMVSKAMLIYFSRIFNGAPPN